MARSSKPVSKNDIGRQVRGRSREGASFPASPPLLSMPSDYLEILTEIKQRIQSERLRTIMAANSVMVQLYWEIGHVILKRQQGEGWGAKVIDRLSTDLRAAFPDLKGFSPRNLLFMRSVAEAYPDPEIVKQVVSHLPWGHVLRLLQREKDLEIRTWYARQALSQGWSRNILELQMDRRAHERQGKAITNFPLTLPPSDSDIATQVFKDPYLFDFLGTADPRKEREVEQALVDHIQRFLLELGAGFAFVGRQVHLEFVSKDYYLDLLFYHLKLRCYVVVELKAVSFDPSFVGTMNMYLSAVDDLLRHPDDKPSIGLLLCKSKDKLEAEYALRGFEKPIGVAEWETQIVRSLPETLKSSLPSVEELETELGND